jgi:hypothetical protein
VGVEAGLIPDGAVSIDAASDAGILDAAPDVAPLDAQPLDAQALDGSMVDARVADAAVSDGAIGVEVDYCNLQWPPTLQVATGTMTSLVYGRLYERGLTEAPGEPPGVLAQVGYGPAQSDPRDNRDWVFVVATYNMQVGNNDEYMARMTAPAAGAYSYAFRFSLNGGAHFTYCDLDGAGRNAGLTFSTAELGTMTVTR